MTRRWRVWRGVLVAPRPGFPVVGAEVLDLPDRLAAVSSSAARGGAHHLIAPECRNPA